MDPGHWCLFGHAPPRSIGSKLMRIDWSTCNTNFFCHSKQNGESRTMQVPHWHTHKICKVMFIILWLNDVIQIKPKCIINLPNQISIFSIKPIKLSSEPGSRSPNYFATKRFFFFFFLKISKPKRISTQMKADAPKHQLEKQALQRVFHGKNCPS
jgi:hypothetical protein